LKAEGVLSSKNRRSSVTVVVKGPGRCDQHLFGPLAYGEVSSERNVPAVSQPFVG
jgi:hypothetical protein